MSQLSVRPTNWSQVPLAMTIEEAARLLGIGRNGCYALATDGRLPVLRLGRRIVVSREALQRLLSEAEGSEPTATRLSSIDGPMDGPRK
jgi:excisionase family DNA binding protein